MIGTGDKETGTLVVYSLMTLKWKLCGDLRNPAEEPSVMSE